MNWSSFLEQARPSVDWQGVGLVLFLDPGETTGWASFNEGLLLECGQWPTPDPSAFADTLHAFIAANDYIDRIVYEEYRVRGNKFNEHVGSEVVTIQNIGAIKVVAGEHAIPLSKQTAGMAKGFATDAKLRRWGLYQKGLKHANDALRHGVYWHLFGTPKEPAHQVGTGGPNYEDQDTR